jgi:hypothetical protein
MAPAQSRCLAEVGVSGERGSGAALKGQAGRVMVHLRRCGVVVHHAAAMPSPANGPGSVVVFLSTTPGQSRIARGCALRMPGVRQVTFSGFSPTVMYVYLDFPARRS